MDVFAPIVIFFVIFALFCLCGACARRRRNENGAVFSSPIIVTSTVQQLPPGASAYPVTVVQGTGQASYPVQPMPNATVYTTHQVQGFGAYPMPQPQYQQQPGFSYPPTSYPPQTQPAQPPMHPGQFVNGQQFNPPTYDQVIGGGGPGAGVQQAGYQKQSPYNPGYSGN